MAVARNVTDEENEVVARAVEVVDVRLAPEEMHIADHGDADAPIVNHSRRL
jgi:hypothetical protein